MISLVFEPWKAVRRRVARLGASRGGGLILRQVGQGLYPEAMKLGWAQSALRGLILLALGVSVALLVDYTAASPAFCGGTSGCAAVRDSGLGYVPLGDTLLPVPVIGVVALLVLFVLASQAKRRCVSLVLCLLSSLGAVLALGLLALQAYLSTYCWLCVVVDASLLGICGLAFWVHIQSHRRARTPREWLAGATWWGLLGLTFLGPLLYPWVVAPAAVPHAITRLYQPGELTVLEFFDFQCPHCRSLSPRLKQIVAATPGARLRLGYTPLPGHEGSLQAAQLTICAGEQQREMELAAEFFKQTDFSEPRLLATARKIVPDAAQLDACLASPRPHDRVRRDTEALKTAGFVGLPTTYIGQVRILGADHDRVYEDALHQAKNGAPTRLPPGVYWLCFVIVVGVVAYWGRAEGQARGTGPLPS
jgi:predicted DsbA family dithiol-disulfide isomerase